MPTPTYYLTFDSSENVTGSGATPDGTVPKDAIECTQQQAENPQAWAISNGAIVSAPATQLLAQAQAAQIAIITQACAGAITGGFSSSALGSAHTYPSQPNDQSNLIGAATASQSPTLPAGWTCNFWCADSTGAWALRAHTAAQIQQVLADGVAAREALSTKLAALVAQVEAATTVAAVQSIVWA